MRLAFLQLPAEERRIDVEEVGTRRNISPVIVEKGAFVPPAEELPTGRSWVAASGKRMRICGLCAPDFCSQYGLNANALKKAFVH